MTSDLTMQGRGNMAVGVERKADRAVAKKLLHDLWMDPSRKQMGSSRMSEVMYPHVRQSSPSEGLMELSAHAAGI